MKVQRVLAAVLAFVLLAGCSDQAGTSKLDTDGYIDQVPLVEIEDEAVALSEAPLPATAILLKPEASGKLTQTNSRVTIDYSNTADGYIMVKASDGGKKQIGRAHV